MSFRWRLLERFAPLLAVLPPWWRVRVYSRLAGKPFEQGGFRGREVRRSIAPHGFEMSLRLDDWMERHAALTGIFYAIEETEALRWLLRPGDAFVDVGANIGFVTLTGARLVGDQGRVIAIEPNSELFLRLQDSIVRNSIKNVVLHQCALGESEGHANLLVSAHHGLGSLRHGGVGGVKVRVVPGNELTSDIGDSTWCVVKIDVEGYEQRVLNGLSEMVARSRTAFFIEISDEWLRALGGSAELLFATMQEAGYAAFQPALSRKGRFELKQMEGHISSLAQYDVIFIRTADGWPAR